MIYTRDFHEPPVRMRAWFRTARAGSSVRLESGEVVGVGGVRLTHRSQAVVEQHCEQVGEEVDDYAHEDEGVVAEQP